MPGRRGVLDEQGPLPFQAQVRRLLPLPSRGLRPFSSTEIFGLFRWRRDWAKVEEDSRKALALDDALFKVSVRHGFIYIICAVFCAFCDIVFV